VPAVQPAQGHAVQPAGLCRAVAQLRGRARRRRPPGAQKLGQRFKVSGYPTVVLFGADGTEITRLPGEADAPQVMAVLQLGLAGGRPVKAVLADALAGKP
jgi:hypothetical protein